MIQIEDTRELPSVRWNALSGKEFMIMEPSVREFLLSNTYQMKVVKREDEVLMVAGLHRMTLTDLPFFWALLSPSFDISAVRILRHYPLPACWTYIEAGNVRAGKLGKTFGFRPVEGGVLMGDTMYDVYRRG